MDYAAELLKLLQEKPELRHEAQRVFFEGAQPTDEPNVTTNSYERIYKAVKALADKQSLKA